MTARATAVACDTIAAPRIYQPDGCHWRARAGVIMRGRAPTEPPSAGHDQVAPPESQVPERGARGGFGEARSPPPDRQQCRSLEERKWDSLST
jgi:hypothetical protein